VGDEIDNLTPAEWESLRRYAYRRMQRAPEMVGKGPEDLLAEALMRYARGKRRRVPGQPLVEHLFGVMHSVAGSWSRWKKHTAETASGLMNYDEDDDTASS
jgi:DNA-directed RNA polymerase specialized sigma24 family protein